MNWAVAFPATAFLGDTLLLVLVVKGAWRSQVGRKLALYLAALAAASFSSWMMHAEVWPGPTFWFKLIITSSLLGMPLIIGFATVFPRPRPRRQQKLILLPWYLFSAVLLILNALGYAARSASSVPGQEGIIQVEFGPAMPAVFLSMPTMLLCVVALHASLYWSTSNKVERRSVLYPLAGTGLLVFGGVTNINPSLSRYPIDQLFFLGNALLLSYAVLRLRMLDIGSTLRRGAVYSILTVTITLLYLVVALVSSQGLLGKVPGRVDLAGIAVLALFIAVAYEPLRHRLQRAVDSVFFKERYEYGTTVEEFSRKIATLLDLDELAGAIIRVIVDTLQLDMGALFLWREEERQFQLLIALSPRDAVPDVPKHVEREVALDYFLREERSPILLQSQGDGRFQQLLDPGLRLALPLWVKQEPIGFALLGSKLSGDPYFEEDLILLSTFANQISTALENARLFADLQTLEREHRSLIEDMNDGYILTQDLRIRFANSRFAQMLGHSVEEVVGERVSRFCAPETMKEMTDHFQALEQKGAPIPSQVAGLGVRKDGSTVRIEASIRPTEFKGKPAATAILRDVTQREMLQEQLLRSEKLRALGLMAGGVAHDLNNRLAALLAGADICWMLLERPEVDLGKLREHVQMMLQTVEDGTNTVRRLQQFAVGRKEPPERAFAPVDLNQVVQEITALTRPRWEDEMQAQGRTIELVTDLKPIPSVPGNPAQLREVLTNLILNAVDAMPTGGALTFGTWVEEGQACLSVSDTGIGMTDEARHRCFDPFFTTKGPGSSGLGLSICFGVVQEHRGTISVRSKPGAGTTFIIRLPLAEVQVEAGARTKAPFPASLHVLLVDDEESVREPLATVLELAGHQVETASGGAEALAMIEKQQFDVLITDLGMPDLNGWDVAMQAKQRRPDLPVLLLTGWGQRLEDARQSHIDGMVAKPVRVEELQNVLRRVTE